MAQNETNEINSKRGSLLEFLDQVEVKALESPELLTERGLSKQKVLGERARNRILSTSSPSATIARMNATIREQHQRLVRLQKQATVSDELRESRPHPNRLSDGEIRHRLQEFPLQMQGLADLRTLWRALIVYSTTSRSMPKLVHMLNVERLSILESIRKMVQPLNQEQIDRFVAGINNQLQNRWKALIGTLELWNQYFA